MVVVNRKYISREAVDDDKLGTPDEESFYVANKRSDSGHEGQRCRHDREQETSKCR